MVIRVFPLLALSGPGSEMYSRQRHFRKGYLPLAPQLQGRPFEYAGQSPKGRRKRPVTTESAFMTEMPASCAPRLLH